MSITGVAMADIRCPKCGGFGLGKYGKTPASLQKYRCLKSGCGRQFVAGSDHLIDPEKKKIVIALLAQGTPPKKIEKAVPGISLRWIYELRRRAL